jgi:aclacinomycin oxidase
MHNRLAGPWGRGEEPGHGSGRYQELFAESGGVPAPGEACDGAFINHPDVDLADQALNTSGVPWHTLYYKDNYSRLQGIKARWDPRDVFRHALSIRVG